MDYGTDYDIDYEIRQWHKAMTFENAIRQWHEAMPLGSYIDNNLDYDMNYAVDYARHIYEHF